MNTSSISEHDLHRVCYTLAHVLLPNLFLEAIALDNCTHSSEYLLESKPSAFDVNKETVLLQPVAGPGKRADTTFLEATWQMACHDESLDFMPLHDSFIMEHFEVQDIDAMLFTFPKPTRMLGAHYAVAIRQANSSYRYFTLEKTRNKVYGADADAMVGEWRQGRNHRNHGVYKGRVRDKAQFISTVLGIFTTP